jgi:hypothetical protein
MGIMICMGWFGSSGQIPFSHSALDIKTYARAMLGGEYRSSCKRNMPSRWFGRVLHTHVPLDDAIEQRALLCNMLTENLRRAAGERER